ncbi:N-acetyltransferase GCN5 [Paucilactobacillus hokkaidonensis JCM 18461]|uniref:N-acetyltransferase GCN5 n=2 Tax=Paucilactobacillus hokkaidonensis TaxID=1193095 RepID=A0A0A1H1L1_9LACO|nr:GNAT family N-acetyltransferase [Paucilactobacillus hokkaidonensis]KRO08774.1 N-acetyltransferase GCN5 [Paucilactobacillus hokkaidonensis]BAP86616.1 N-acetyltransferase GCN5 [Paucilactobacillus hokkaidonensis JCM 18461]
MSAAYVRQATNQDLPIIKAIMADAKSYLKQQGIDQWQDGYPSDQNLVDDINNEITYVLIIDGQIAGTAALWQGIDLNYLKIEDGSWLNGVEARYTAIHRIALSGNFRGQHLSEKLISGLLTVSRTLGYHDVRIDTHPDNVGMQHVIATNGFDYRGIIYMHDGSAKRFAYQLLLE